MKHIITSGVIAVGMLAFLGTGSPLSAQSTTPPATRLAQDTSCASQMQPMGESKGVTDSAGINKAAGAPAPSAKGMTDSAGINKPTESPAAAIQEKGKTDSAGINKAAGSPSPSTKGMTDSAGINKPNGSMKPPCPVGMGAGVGADSLKWPAARTDSIRPPSKP